MKIHISILFASIIVFTTFSQIPAINADAGQPFLIVEKNISQSKIRWSDSENVTIKIKNEGSSLAKDINLSDQIPAGFQVNNDNITTTEDTVNIHIPFLDAGDEHTVTYSLTGKQGMSGNTKIFLHPTDITFVDIAGIHHETKSNGIEVTVESVSWEVNFAGTIVFLIIVTFVAGYSGSVIKIVTLDHSDKEKIKKNFKDLTSVKALIGGAAGVMVLGSFQGLSTLFTGEFFRLNLQTMIVLLSTCFASGFAPQAIIDKSVQKWKDKATDEGNKSDDMKNQNTDVTISNDTLIKKENECSQLLAELNEKYLERGKRIDDLIIANNTLEETKMVFSQRLSELNEKYLERGKRIDDLIIANNALISKQNTLEDKIIDLMEKIKKRNTKKKPQSKQ